jgi:hypothetical protein
MCDLCGFCPRMKAKKKKKADNGKAKEIGNIRGK